MFLYSYKCFIHIFLHKYVWYCVCTLMSPVQDSLVALQALAVYGKSDPNRAIYEIVVKLQSTATSSWERTIRLNKDNWMTAQRVKVRGSPGTDDTHVDMCMQMLACSAMCKHGYSYIHTCTHACTHGHTHARTHGHTYTHTHGRAHIDTHTRTHTCTRTHTHLISKCTLYMWVSTHVCTGVLVVFVYKCLHLLICRIFLQVTYSHCFNISLLAWNCISD